MWKLNQITTCQHEVRTPQKQPIQQVGARVNSQNMFNLYLQTIHGLMASYGLELAGLAICYGLASSMTVLCDAVPNGTMYTTFCRLQKHAGGKSILPQFLICFHQSHHTSYRVDTVQRQLPLSAPSESQHRYPDA